STLIISPSCLVLIIGSLVWTTCAHKDFEFDRERLIEVYKNANPDSIGDGNVLCLISFLDKYGDQIQLTPEQRSKASDVVRQYKEEKAKQPLVDGAPPQGGWFTKLVRALVVQLGIELASEGFKKATES
ncbi:hypothetical protein KR054_006244, partial [Drosophila jambulina]